MKNAIRTVLLALFLVLAGNATAEAQSPEFQWALTYQTALSTGETKDFIDQFSWRNIGLEGRSMLNPDFSVGAFFGWNVFHDELDGTVSLGNVDASGYQSRYVNALPMLLTAHYYLGDRSGTRMFLGTGVGTYWIENRLELGQTKITLDNWHFGLAPEVGISIPTAGLSDAFLSVKYNYAFESGGVTHRYWTFGIGLGGGF